MKEKLRKNKPSDVSARQVVKMERFLFFMAKTLLNKYTPRIIAVTGSVGKTSAKEAIFAVISGRYSVRKSEKNYNNEIGVPLTIIGAESGGKSLLKWIGVFLHWLLYFIFPLKFPEIIILEMGADKPGDLKYLTDLAQPDISVITEIASSHLEFFKNIDAIFKEKATLARVLSEKGLLIINTDNKYLLKIKENPRQFGVTGRIFSFGFKEDAAARAMDVFMNYHGDENDLSGKEVNGLSFKLSYKGTTMPLRLNNVLARHNIYAALVGVSVGIELGVNLVDIAASLEKFILPSGRTNLIRGMRNTNIIDDTYNSSSVTSVEGVLEVLREFRNSRKIVVLGDILEIGPNTEAEHRQVAKKFLEIGGDVFLAVGVRMKFAADELRKHKFAGEIYEFRSPMEAGKKLQELLRSGDVVLVKGSQGMRMEKVVEEVMAEPNRAEELLCRQNLEWKDKPWQEV
ncbi:MAG: UDP-N-acetylmuramoyl-tripeptide--D-alanyl-D-alanine ligase [Candidatus Moraniibacteriota bacterium]